MSNKLTPADFGAAPGGTPITGSNTTTTAPTGVTGPVPSLPGAGQPMAPIPAEPIPAVTEGDPAQFVDSDGKTKAQIMEAEMHAEEEAEKEQDVLREAADLAAKLKNPTFAEEYAEAKMWRDHYLQSANPLTGPSPNVFEREVFTVLNQAYAELVTRLEQMPAPQVI